MQITGHIDYMIDNSNIDKIIYILKKEIKYSPQPAIEKVSQKHHTPFHILVSTMLSARTKDQNTIRVCEELFRKVKNNNDLLKIEIKTLKRIVYPAGFYKNKSQNLKKMALVLKNFYNNRVPDTLEELIKLPGVGRKTANLVLINAFNKYGICVDTHVHRITNRWGYVQTSLPDKTEIALRNKLPKHLWKIINYILVTYGKLICKPIRPLCSECKISCYCPYPEKIASKGIS